MSGARTQGVVVPPSGSSVLAGEPFAQGVTRAFKALEASWGGLASVFWLRTPLKLKIKPACRVWGRTEEDTKQHRPPPTPARSWSVAQDAEGLDQRSL